MALYKKSFSMNGHKFTLVAKLSERTEEPEFNQIILVDGKSVGAHLEGRFSESFVWLKDNWWKYESYHIA